VSVHHTLCYLLYTHKLQPLITRVLDFEITKNCRIPRYIVTNYYSQPISSSCNVFCYVINGKSHLVRLRIEAEKGKAVIFKKYWKQVTMRSVPNSKSPLEILFIAEISLNEPVA
jgi:hypothetical protein